MGKRGRNKNRQGGYSKRGDGRFEVYITVDTPEGPKQIRTTKRTEEEAEEWLLAARYESSRGSYLSIDSPRLTVGEFVRRWLEDSVRDSVRKVTYIGYEKTFRLYVAPGIGTARLSKLTPAYAQAWRRRLVSEVSPSEAGKAIQLLKRALRQAAAWEMIARNPAEHLKSPRYKPKETGYIRTEDAWRYFEAMAGDPYEALFILAATGGPRPAEMLALRWDDLDERAGTIRIDESVSELGGGEYEWNEPKTASGRRVIPLSEQALSALCGHRKRALERRIATGVRGDFDGSLVFGRSDDPERPYGIDALRWRWYALQERAGLKRVTLYALRHTTCMLLARAKVDPRTVQGILGHADIVTTLRHYTHFEDEQARAAVRSVDELLAENRR